MKIPVNQRLGLAEKFLSEARRRNFERTIAAQVADDFVELRRGMSIALAREVWIPKDQIYGNADQRLISGEQRDTVHFAFERPRKVGREVARTRDVLAEVAGEIRVTAPGNQTVPQDDVRR